MICCNITLYSSSISVYLCTSVLCMYMCEWMWGVAVMWSWFLIPSLWKMFNMFNITTCSSNSSYEHKYIRNYIHKAVDSNCFEEQTSRLLRRHMSSARKVRKLVTWIQVICCKRKKQADSGAGTGMTKRTERIPRRTFRYSITLCYTFWTY